MAEYHVHYSGGKMRTAADGPLTGDDARDVQVIVQDDGDGPVLVTGGDYYVWMGTFWRSVDIFGLFDYLLETGLVLFGRTVTRDEYNAIWQRAKLDKRTWRPKERRPDDT